MWLCYSLYCACQILQLRAKGGSFQPKLSRECFHMEVKWIGIYYGLPIYLVFEEVIAKELSKELTSSLNWSERGCFSPSSLLIAGIAWGEGPELWLCDSWLRDLKLDSLPAMICERGTKTLSQSFVTLKQGDLSTGYLRPFLVLKGSVSMK